ncbi:MAG: DUF4153 domain-containing protein [Rickettsiaceae bacterium]|nr:DUF4153 domain-containing protein [Rickettsiaceae bacterium]
MITFKFRQINERLKIITSVLLRFWLPVICAATATFLLLLKTNKIEIGISHKSWLDLLLLCGFFGYTALRLFTENHNISTLAYTLLMSAVGAFLSFFCVSPNIIQLSLLLLGVMIILPVSPYILDDLQETRIAHFAARLVSSTMFSFLVIIILCIGVSSALTTINDLLDIKIPSLIHSNIWVIGLALFCPILLLYRVSADVDEKTIEEYPNGLAFILSYILSPLLIVYLLILYAYIIKILITWTLPKGTVATIVLVFGITGTLIYIFSYPLRKTGGITLKLVHDYFYYALLAPTLLLLLSITIRVNNYGITEARYLVLILTLWFFFLSAYFILSKNPIKNSILTISTLLILSSFGPWGACHISGLSQTTRLKHLLQKNNILINGTIHKISEEISSQDQKNISAIIGYLSMYHKTHLIKNWFSSDSYINSTKDKNLDDTKIMDDMGLIYINPSFNS